MEERRNKMKFKEAYYEMLKGKKIKRPCFEGYWFIDGYKGNVVIHCRDGKEITNDVDLDLTLKNVMAEDWQVVKEKEAK